MKVSKLIKLLQKEDQNREVILASDSEGNSYSLLTDGNLSISAYRKYGYEIGIGLEKLTPALEAEGYSEEDVLEGGKPALVIYP